jgi:hypothetical protein
MPLSITNALDLNKKCNMQPDANYGKDIDISDTVVCIAYGY